MTNDSCKVFLHWRVWMRKLWSDLQGILRGTIPFTFPSFLDLPSNGLYHQRRPHS